MDPKSIKYKNYGGRGITICQEWVDSFEAFLRDVGPRPPGGTIERINSNGNYEPRNVRWATQQEQNCNTCRTVRVRVGDKVMALSEACKLLNLSYSMANKRLRRGATVDGITRVDDRQQKVST